MKIVRCSGVEDYTTLLKRPEKSKEELDGICRSIFGEVNRDGDAALLKYTWFFDRVRLDELQVSDREWENAEQEVAESLKQAILLAREHIGQFHRLQLPGKQEYVNENGFRCWQEWRPIERVGLYVPGGSAPLFSTVLMLAIPAMLAGCREVVLCTPPGSDGKIAPAILWAASLCGVKRVFKLGGVQAIAAMTLGTESIPRVDKLYGPGNQYVTAAKQLALSYGVAIDMPAGPSELMVVADATARAEFVAADLLSQAEHGIDSQVILLAMDPELPERVNEILEQQLQQLPRREIAAKALQYAVALVVEERERCLEIINAYAPEHLILAVSDNKDWVEGIRNAGSVFLGNYTPESAGDYASGTNHTLPTGGAARAYGALGVDAFIKKIAFQESTPRGLAYLGDIIACMAEQEGLTGHRRAVEIRTKEF